MVTAVKLTPIAHIRSEFPTKFGIPRQAGLVPELSAQIVFEPRFRNPDAVRGLDGFSHIWLVWEFSAAIRDHWRPMVRPPRLGGEQRMGVFATRSPFRPNPIGLSAVKLHRISDQAGLGPVLSVGGADLLDGTPIYDIKPYLAVDRMPATSYGFTSENNDYRLRVEISDELLVQVPAPLRPALLGVLAEDPRPAYQDDPDRRYGLDFAGFEVKFTVAAGVLYVQQITAN